VSSKRLVVTFAILLGLGGCDWLGNPSNKPLSITETNPLALPVLAPINLLKVGSVAEVIFEIPEKTPKRDAGPLHIGLIMKLPARMVDKADYSEMEPLYMGKYPLRAEVVRLSAQNEAVEIIPLARHPTEQELATLAPGEWNKPLDQSVGFSPQRWSSDTLDFQAKGLDYPKNKYQSWFLAYPKTTVPGRYKAKVTVLAALNIPEGITSEIVASRESLPK
jgi:hypothetical protein